MPSRLETALAGEPPATIAEVIALMGAVGRCLPVRDGVACFTRLYLAVTEAVDEDVARRRFAATEFLVRLDVRFANLYFDALRDLERAPRAWAPLVEARGRTDVAPIQFALAGMNAHINRDLPVALVETCEELGVELRRGGAEHGDFLAVNALLEATEERVKRDFATGIVGVADVAFGAVDDVVAMWNVARARDAAWANAETLWAIRREPELSAAFLLTLDRMVGFAGRGLLRPAPRSLLRRALGWLARRVRG